MNNDLLVSYLSLRKSIGFIALGMPVFLVIGSIWIGDCSQIQSSISDYYHTVMRDGLVGTICAISFFLFAYRGYDVKDFWATRAAAVLALFVAFFPTIYTDEIYPPCNVVRPIENPLVNAIHFSSALLFFLVLAYISLFLFTKTDHPQAMGQRKKHRNRVYKTCGWVMLACLALLALYFAWLRHRFPGLAAYDPVFWLESLALWAFGISWLIKGEIFMKDLPQPPAP
ncbi:hypothetical protein OZ410_07630 [Robiginitalea sp. M366]|uniref:hypothetical protein n=1 Tax=Robiginitalea aestuariiviva TaxID=3036903 RepID=UPI00240E9A96|nr:hypothetical protein [Robiginitalea aestuariiviva]MDG1572183.1 hypothetical protein [Robiginitalea aestuariiviva]